MNKFSFLNEETRFNILSRGTKVIIGNNHELIYKLKNTIRYVFQKHVKSDYLLEKETDVTFKFNDNNSDIKNWNFLEITDAYDLRSEAKLNSGSLLSKYMLARLETLATHDDFLTLQNCFLLVADAIADMQEATSNNLTTKVELPEFNVSILLKLLSVNFVYEGKRVEQVSTRLEDTILLQLQMAKELSNKNEKMMAIMIDVPFLSKEHIAIIDSFDKKTCFIFAFVEELPEVDYRDVGFLFRRYFDILDKDKVEELLMNYPKNYSYEDACDEIEKMVKHHTYSPSDTFFTYML